MQPHPTTFGILLRRFRGEPGLTQETLAERAGLTAREISNLERGERAVPQSHTLHRLAVALHLSPQDRVLLKDAARHPLPPVRIVARRSAEQAHAGLMRQPWAGDPATPKDHAVAHLLAEISARQAMLADLMLAGMLDAIDAPDAGRSAIS